jgi:hypothetical protein
MSTYEIAAGTRNPITRRFIRHYLEMVAVMFLGMAVVGLPAGVALSAVDSSWSALRADGPALWLLLMAFTMTAPMVAWMRWRGHGGRATGEMALAMIVPTFAAIALLGTGVADVGALVVLEHVAMLVAMFAVMALRPQEYSHA